MSGTEKSLWPLPEWWLTRALVLVAKDLLLAALDGWKRLAWCRGLSQTLYWGLWESRAYLSRSKKHPDELNPVVLSLTSGCFPHFTKNIPCPSHLTSSACSLGGRSGHCRRINSFPHAVCTMFLILCLKTTCSPGSLPSAQLIPFRKKPLR